MRTSSILALALAVAPAAAVAAGGGVTLYGGYRGGGGFTDTLTGQSIDVKGSGTVAASIDFPLDASRQVQFYVSHQNSEFEALSLAGTPASELNGQSMSVTYLHLGGTVFATGQVGHGLYAVGGLGVTLFNPGASGYSSELRPSMNVGFGYHWPLSRNVALRFEARGYLTLVNSEGGLFCSGGCVVTIKGDTFAQGDAQIGLSLRF